MTITRPTDCVGCRLAGRIHASRSHIRCRWQPDVAPDWLYERMADTARIRPLAAAEVVPQTPCAARRATWGAWLRRYLPHPATVAVAGGLAAWVVVTVGGAIR